jgi:hypothetical protein
MSLAKNLGGRVGVNKILKILLQICDNPSRSQKFSEKNGIFKPKKSKISSKMPF